MTEIEESEDRIKLQVLLWTFQIVEKLTILNGDLPERSGDLLDLEDYRDLEFRIWNR